MLESFEKHGHFPFEPYNTLQESVSPPVGFTLKRLNSEASAEVESPRKRRALGQRSNRIAPVDRSQLWSSTDMRVEGSRKRAFPASDGDPYSFPDDEDESSDTVCRSEISRGSSEEQPISRSRKRPCKPSEAKPWDNHEPVRRVGLRTYGKQRRSR